MIKQIGLSLRGRPILLITHMITDRIRLKLKLIKLIKLIIVMVIVIIVINFIVTVIFIIIIINKITTPFTCQLSESDITFDIDIGPIVLEKNNTGKRKQLQNKAFFFQLLSPNLRLRLENGAVYFYCLTFYRSQTFPL